MVRSRKRDSEDLEMEDATKGSEVEDNPEDEGGEQEDDEEAEYEIEAILDAKNGQFGDGRLGYLVKWKGYPESENSWVSEGDASNAKVLIDAYWKEHGGRAGKKAAPRKSDPKAKTSAVEKHRSPIVVADEDSDVPAPAKKRGKPSKSASDDEGHEKSSKRAKQNASASAASKKKARAPVEEEPEEGYVNMKQWKNAASWAHLVDHIETVERTSDDELIVYFALKGQNGKDGRLAREKVAICREKMPNLMMDFYEANLRWRTVSASPS